MAKEGERGESERREDYNREEGGGVWGYTPAIVLWQ